MFSRLADTLLANDFNSFMGHCGLWASEACIIRQPELNCHLSCNYLLTIFSCLCLNSLPWTSRIINPFQPHSASVWRQAAMGCEAILKFSVSVSSPFSHLILYVSCICRTLYISSTSFWSFKLFCQDENIMKESYGIRFSGNVQLIN